MNYIYMNIFLLFCLAIQIYFTVSSGIRWYKSDPLKWYKEQLEKFINEHTILMQKQIDEVLENYKQQNKNRWDLLSKENSKLREENEKYRDKLKNLGFSDVALDT